MESKYILESGKSLFDYRILGFVGEGNWSYVYKAQHPELPMYVAIKQLKREWATDEDALQRFRREAETVARINHPNVVSIYNLKRDRETGLYYIFTEFADKGTLADRLEELPAGLPVGEVLLTAMDICSGLAAAHQEGIIHRDVKPSNILLFSGAGGHNISKLGDFGIARVSSITDTTISSPDGPVGTVCYVSPEQLDKDIEVDHRSDLYSLGIVLYKLLTGEVPFSGTAHDVFWAHKFFAPAPPSELRPDIGESLEQIVMRALQKHPDNRYQSASDMYEALKAIEDISGRRERRLRFEAYLERGLVHLEGKEWELAIEELGQADVLEPGNKQVREGLETARRAQSIRRLYDLAVQYLEEGEWENARESLAKVIAYDPDYADGRAGQQLKQATQEMERDRVRRDLMVWYGTGMGHFGSRRWVQAIAELKKVVDEDPDFEDAAARLEDAHRYVRARDLYNQAQLHKEREEWEEVVNRLMEAKSLGSPVVDVTEELEEAWAKWDLIRGEQQLAGWYREGVAQQEAGHLEPAEDLFQRVCDRQPEYEDAAERLWQTKTGIRIARLFERALEYESDCSWEAAIGVYWEVLEVDRRACKALRRLLRAHRCLEGGWLVSTAARVQNWWDDWDCRAKMILNGSLALIVLVLSIGGVWAVSSSRWFRRVVSSPVLDNGDFEGCLCLDCWHHGGDLDQTVECDEDRCYFVLGSPDYPCYGGVPVGEAWIKQAFQVPKEISPTLSLRYRVFSHDLDLPGFDYLQVAINGEPLPERYGNYDWHEPSCDREPWDSQWQTLSLDLSDYRGEEIEVSFHNVNGTQPHYNTWTYIDDVKID